MKNLLIVLAVAVSFLNLSAQHCHGKKCFTKGTKFTFENKKDGKTIGTDKQEVINVVSTSQGVESTISSQSSSDKTGPVNYTITCNGNTMSLDLKALLGQEMMRKMGASGVEAKIVSSDNIEFPVSAKPGTELNDAKVTIEIGIQGNPIGTVKIHVKNRKVEKEEQITTEAGSFSCLKIVGDFEMETTIMGAVNKKSSKNTSWINSNVGPVKTQNTDAAGKIENVRTLVKVE